MLGFGRKRDGAWFARQVQSVKSTMFYVALSILHNEWDAEAATANAILKAYENLDSLRDPKSYIGSWPYPLHNFAAGAGERRRGRCRP